MAPRGQEANKALQVRQEPKVRLVHEVIPELLVLRVPPARLGQPARPATLDHQVLLGLKARLPFLRW